MYSPPRRHGSYDKFWPMAVNAADHHFRPTAGNRCVTARPLARERRRVRVFLARRRGCSVLPVAYLRRQS